MCKCFTDCKTATNNLNFKKTEKLVQGVFSSVAKKYDIMNDVMSFGIHRFWKEELVKKVLLQKGIRILDMAGGTGDLSFLLYSKLKKRNIQDFNLTIADFNQEMLDYGQKKALDKNIISKNISWHQDNGEKSKFKNQSFDYYLNAYGLRNFTDLKKGVAEAFRVLKKGGVFLCLEFNQVENKFLQKLYDFYSLNIIPKIGSLITGDEESYKYFVESIRMFPDSKKFQKMLEQAGFSSTTYQKLTFGITTLYIAKK